MTVVKTLARLACDDVDMSDATILSSLSHHIWDTRYRLRDHGGRFEATIADTWRRVAHALASVERHDVDEWRRRYGDALCGFRFLPGGRILAGAGTSKRSTLFNCFVMGTVDDTLQAIFDALKEGALTMQLGGGVGIDFSTLRPRGQRADHADAIASGPVSFMRVWDSMCATLIATNARRGAMMATLACDHPDIEAFVAAKARPGELRHFNLSVLATDAFMSAVAADEHWPLQFPCANPAPLGGKSRHREESRVRGIVPARVLWDRIMRANYAYAEPGVVFIDRVNALDNLHYAEGIRATNPCGEVPLPPYGACDLGSLNLTQFVRSPFERGAALDWDALRDTTAVAVRMLDNVYELSYFPLPQQAAAARKSRRLGIGITGLADALIMLGHGYDTPDALELAGSCMREICHAAYRASAALAEERGPCPAFDRDAYLDAPFVRGLPADIRDAIARHGIRNSHLTAIAPTGSISLLANNVSSGLEPVFAAHYHRVVRDEAGEQRIEPAVDYAVALFHAVKGTMTGLPPHFVTAAEISPEAQLNMQAALQEHVDNAISKTITVPVDLPFDRFRGIFERAYALGLKGCTTFRPNPVTGAVLIGDEPEVDSCCALPLHV